MASAQFDVDWQSTKKTVLQRTRHMFNNSDMSDISFTCEDSATEKKFYAHKYVLGTSSTVFHAMFFGDLAEKSLTLRLGDTDGESLSEFLRFLYTDECNLTANNVVSVMYLSKKYIVPSLTEECVGFLERGIEPENVLIILEQAIYFDEKELEAKCWKVVDWHIKEIMTFEDFFNLKQGTLASLLKRESLITQEIALFNAVLKWADFQCLQKGLVPTAKNKRSVIGEAVYELRFLALMEKEFQHVADSELLTSDEIVAIQGRRLGISHSELKWQHGVRKVKYDILAFKRYGMWKSCGYEHKVDDQPYCMHFSVDREALFHGVRFFGDLWDNQYKVTMEIEGIKVKGTYKSKTMSDSYPGYCVMLKLPLLIQKNKVVKVLATIKGPPTAYGYAYAQKSNIKVDSVTVMTFYPEPPEPGSNIFHKILLSI